MDKNELKEILLDVEREKINALQLQQNVQEESSIDWKELLVKAWKGKKTIIAGTVVFMVLGLASALTMTRSYTATVTLMPEMGKSSSSSSLSGIASMLGIGGLSTGASADAISVLNYPDVVSSTPFTTKLFNMKVVDSENDIDTTLYGYLTREKFSVTKAVFSLFASKEDETEKKTVDVFRLTKKQAAVVKAINTAVGCNVDKKTGQTTITVKMDNPVIAATMADTICQRLKDFVTEYRTSKAREDLESYQKMADESYQHYLKASRAYAYYQDHNRGLILNSAISEGTRLSNELNIATQVYQQTKAQAEMARTKVIEEKPVFVVLQPATVPLLPANSRAKVLLMWTFLGFVLSAVWVLFGQEYLAKGKEMLNEAKANS